MTPPPPIVDLLGLSKTDGPLPFYLHGDRDSPDSFYSPMPSTTHPSVYSGPGKTNARLREQERVAAMDLLAWMREENAEEERRQAQRQIRSERKWAEYMRGCNERDREWIERNPELAGTPGKLGSTRSGRDGGRDGGGGRRRGDRERDERERRHEDAEARRRYEERHTPRFIFQEPDSARPEAGGGARDRRERHG